MYCIAKEAFLNLIFDKQNSILSTNFNTNTFPKLKEYIQLYHLTTYKLGKIREMLLEKSQN